MALPGYYPFLHTDPAPPNYGFSPAVGLKDPEMDKLLDDMAAENNFQKRRQKFKKCVLYAKEKAFWLPYAVEIGYRVWNKKLNNYKPLDYFFPEKALVEAWLET